MWRGEREAFSILREKVDPNARYIWVHAASLGEFEQGRPLIEQIRQEHPEFKILLTFFSPSGYEVRKNYAGADIICYLPLDTIRNARRFLRLIRPEIAFFIKYEFWYNYLHILKHRNVPVYSVSSIFREGQVFFRWYGKQYSRVLKCFTHFYVQNETSCQLLERIGLTNVTITGDTRFDRVLQIKDAAKKLSVVEAFIKDCPNVFVAGSSWPPDEEIFIKYFNEHREWKLIIAPHVIGEDHLKQIEKLLDGRKIIRYAEIANEPEASQGPALNTADVLIINCFGLLSSIYHYGNVTYVGGGFGVGIHNVLEAAVWGKPVIIGPNNKKFQEAQELLAAGGCFEIASYEDFEQRMNRFVQEPEFLKKSGQQAADYVMGKAGATRKILSNVASHLK
jgi:3-deoxy-D-manno-octulosonic-acid transferase